MVKYIQPSFNIFYINLEESKDRNRVIKSNFKKINFPKKKIKRINGIKIKNLTKKIKTKFKNLSKAEIGCFKAHINALKNVSKLKTNESVLILEDDAILTKSCINFIQKFIKLNSNFDILFLSNWNRGNFKKYYKNNKILKNIIMENNSTKFTKLNKIELRKLNNGTLANFWIPMWYLAGMTGYLVNKKSATKILNIYNKDKIIDVGIDTYLSRLCKKLNIYITDKRIISELPRKNHKSTIGSWNRGLPCNKLGLFCNLK